MKIYVNAFALISFLVFFIQPAWGVFGEGDDTEASTPRGVGSNPALENMGALQENLDDIGQKGPQRLHSSQQLSEDMVEEPQGLSGSQQPSEDMVEGIQGVSNPAMQIQEVDISSLLPDGVWLLVFTDVFSMNPYEAFNNRESLKRVSKHFHDLMNDKAIGWLFLSFIKGRSLDNNIQPTVEYAAALQYIISQTKALESQNGQAGKIFKLYMKAFKDQKTSLFESNLIVFKLKRFLSKNQDVEEVKNLPQEDRFRIISRSSAAMGSFFDKSKKNEDIKEAFFKLFLPNSLEVRKATYPDQAKYIEKINVVEENTDQYYSDILRLISLNDSTLPVLYTVACLKKAAELNNRRAQYRLGLCFRDGHPKNVVQQNWEKAVEWWTKAASQGHSKAQYWLGLCHSCGKGVPKKSWEEAMKWYQLAADQGNIMAQREVAFCYFLGQGVQQSTKKAVQYFTEAARRGQISCQYQLGVYYTENAEGRNSRNEGVKWLRKAAEQGHSKAQYSLGSCYFSEKGVQQNLEEGMKWYHLAAEQGLLKAQGELAKIYFDGTRVPQNLVESTKWLKKAAEQGDTIAQVALGERYNYGIGVPKNPQEADKWFREATKLRSNH